MIFRALAELLAIGTVAVANVDRPKIANVPFRSQPAGIRVVVVDSLSRQKIANADVTDLRSGARTSTDINGQARIVWPAAGDVALRVRQLGYRPVVRDVRRGLLASSSDSVVVELSRIRYVLPQVTTVAASACDAPPDSVSARLSAIALDQIVLGAERYERFRQKYPFRAVIVRRTATMDNRGRPTRLVESKGEVSSETWGDPYRRGSVVQSSGLGFSVPLLFLGTLADPEFWRHHCFLARGIESRSGARLIRLDFEPARTVKTPDWEGSAFIDSATSLLVRVEFRLARLGNSARPRRLEGYTTFKSPSPFFVVPDSTVAAWWKRNPVRGEWGMPDVAQSLVTESIEYRKERPISDPHP